MQRLHEGVEQRLQRLHEGVEGGSLSPGLKPTYADGDPRKSQSRAGERRRNAQENWPGVGARVR